MPRSTLDSVVLSEEERATLERWARRPSSAQALGLRCRIVLACAEGGHNHEVAGRLGIHRHTVGRWRGRFLAERLVGLYLSPPDAAVVFCVDEKSQIQALDRTSPVLPLLPGTPERRTHDYVGHGTTNLYAALDMASGKVITALTERHRAEEFQRRRYRTAHTKSHRR